MSATPELAKALAKAQAAFPVIERTRTVKVKTKTGGEYSFAYAPLDTIREAVKPALTENGLAVSQLLTTDLGGAPALRSVLLHASGESIESVFPFPVYGNLGAQEWGSLITYFRRYALVALLGIATEEDDDGNSASGNQIAGGQETSGGDATPAAVAVSDLSPTPALSEPPANPAEKAMAAQAAHRSEPQDDGKPENVVLEFGKHKGLPLGQIPQDYLEWLDQKFEARNPHQRRAQEAARMLLGTATAPLSASDDDIPF